MIGDTKTLLAQGGDLSPFLRTGRNMGIPLVAVTGELDALLPSALANSVKPSVCLITLGPLASRKSLKLFLELWESGIPCQEYVGNNGITRQLSQAHTNGIALTLIIGQKEALDGTVILRDFRSGIQEVFARERIIPEVKKRLGE
jgi:histidyl-tRNA synthetase